MKIFLAFRFTGEDMKELENTLSAIRDSLKRSGHTVVCSFWKEEYFQKNHYTNKQLLEYMFKELDQCDALLAFVKSEEKSEGMLLEIGYALAKSKQFILVIKNGLQPVFLREIADEVMEFENLSELNTQLESL